MSFAKLIVIQPGHSAREFEIVGELVTIGRALDNTIAVEDDTNVSRYHAEISKRGDSFWIRDLGSSNGTTVNDEPIDFEWQLKNGDLISTGGSTIIEFHLSDVPWRRRRQEARREPIAVTNIEAPPTPPPGIDAAAQAVEQPAPVVTLPSSAPPFGLIVAGVGGGLLLTALVAIVVYNKLTPACNPTARIVSPQTGTIREPVPIRVEVTNKECIDRLIYLLDDKKLASSEVSPYEIVLDPQLYPELAGGNHILSVTVEDEDGNKTLQPDTVVLAFARANQDTASDGNSDASKESATALVSNSEVKEMVGKLAQRVNPKSDYVFDSDFLEQVRSRTSRYATAGLLERAASFHEVIREEFVGNQDLSPALAYVTAFSRSRFAVENASGTDTPQGLWQIQPSIAREYLGQCKPGETLSDPNQKCSAVVASLYVNRLVVDIFRGDFVYAVATLGMSPGEAAQFRDGLQADRRDFWKVIKSGPQRDRVVNFFAAGIVGENPQKFKLRDKSLTSLY